MASAGRWAAKPNRGGDPAWARYTAGSRPVAATASAWKPSSWTSNGGNNGWDAASWYRDGRWNYRSGAGARPARPPLVKPSEDYEERVEDRVYGAEEKERRKQARLRAAELRRRRQAGEDISAEDLEREFREAEEAAQADTPALLELAPADALERLQGAWIDPVSRFRYVVEGDVCAVFRESSRADGEIPAAEHARRVRFCVADETVFWSDLRSFTPSFRASAWEEVEWVSTRGGRNFGWRRLGSDDAEAVADLGSFLAESAASGGAAAAEDDSRASEAALPADGAADSESFGAASAIAAAAAENNCTGAAAGADADAEEAAEAAVEAAAAQGASSAGSSAAATAETPGDALPAPGACGRVVRSFDPVAYGLGADEDYLHLQVGDIIAFIEESEGWWRGRIVLRSEPAPADPTPTEGWYPPTFVVPTAPPFAASTDAACGAAEAS
eukprot:TRINITY_DN55819_c0_g1_i1.p1 TRINITY_DN55819_c0_g1~~TRINITY_DN55819_c0_g1_i1.p1  ORF type:complete len:445 (-),score=138.86 TRINITY_DN55819_c0_g1_i1:142-1476(-)